ncbi:hypothetical protein [Pseudoduganella albidiflava]|uniref:Uncharacterized protein n=1 Tax=Pseudoduganella albidiflava TaxID=321983 RepID=A0A411X4K1_9BURK|nr:hypothetical protein [Pseudoduganella albidiflava]QBI03947.1 hypothetical protein EYF70_26380 [Pseudoduganella albidiflava]GGY23493.1 hypothetical protein GCM10007387_01100 [Pseudoduganella albidiflava]
MMAWNKLSNRTILCGGLGDVGKCDAVDGGDLVSDTGFMVSDTGFLCEQFRHAGENRCPTHECELNNLKAHAFTPAAKGWGQEGVLACMPAPFRRREACFAKPLLHPGGA